MVYLHRFAFSPESDPFLAAWPKMVTDAQTICNVVRRSGVELAGTVGNGDPIFGEHYIALNGPRYDPKLKGSALVIDRRPPDSFDPDFESYLWKGFILGDCDTEAKPYDLAVTAILLRCAQLCPPSFVITSDGSWDTDWAPARSICQTLFGSAILPQQGIGGPLDIHIDEGPAVVTSLVDH